MSRFITVSVVILRLLAPCAAQKLHPCRFSGTSEVSHTHGIDGRRVAVIEPNEEVQATVLIPDGDERVAGIVIQ